MASDPNNFLLTTDYPLDKVVYLKSGFFSMGATTTGTESVTHGLPFTPLVAGYWSLTPDFSINYEFGNGTFPSGSLGDLFQRQISSISATSTIVKMDWSNISTATTVYYRIYAFEPNTSTAALLPISSQGDVFALSTDFNYLKLLEASSAVPGTAATYTVSHNLGYIPQVLAWYEYALVPGFVWPVTTESTVALEVNTTSIIFQNPFGDDVANVWWRIYLDE